MQGYHSRYKGTYGAAGGHGDAEGDAIAGGPGDAQLAGGEAIADGNAQMAGAAAAGNGNVPVAGVITVSHILKASVALAILFIVSKSGRRSSSCH